MSETINGKWITDKDNNKIAPKTFVGQILSNDGTKNLETILDEEIGSLNTSLTHLEFGKNGGGKNILKPTLQTTAQNGVTCTNNGDGTYTLNGTASSTTRFIVATISNLDSSKRYNIIGCPSNGSLGTYSLWSNSSGSKIDVGDGIDGPYNAFKEITIYIYNGTACNNLLFKPMLTTDTTATYNDFEPYIPSVHTLTDNVSSLNTNLTDLKFLGWTVPEEMPIKNYYDETNRVFHQKVGRVDLGALGWSYNETYLRFMASNLLPKAKRLTKNAICNLYEVGGKAYADSDRTDMQISVVDECIFARNFAYTDATAFKTAMSGVYLYYELATEQTFGDGEEIIFRLLNGTATLDVDDVTE